MVLCQHAWVYMTITWHDECTWLLQCNDYYSVVLSDIRQQIMLYMSAAIWITNLCIIYSGRAPNPWGSVVHVMIIKLSLIHTWHSCLHIWKNHFRYGQISIKCNVGLRIMQVGVFRSDRCCCMYSTQFQTFQISCFFVKIFKHPPNI